MYDFLLMVNSNLDCISHAFLATATYCSQSRPWDLPLSHLTSSLGWSLVSTLMNLIMPKKYRVSELLDGEDQLILLSFILKQYRRVGQTEDR